MVKIASRSHSLKDLLNSRDVILLGSSIEGEFCLMGVSKHRSFCHFLEKRDPPGKVEVAINCDYNSSNNCEIEYFPE